MMKPLMGTTFIALLVCLIVPQRTIAQKTPQGVLLRPDGYAIADYPDVFDNASGEGITIEAWFYLTRLPEDGEYWVLFAKPGSYEVIIRGRDLGSRIEQKHPEGAVAVNYTKYVSPHHAARSTSFLHFWPNERPLPLKRWLHLAFQIRGSQDFTFFEGQFKGNGNSSGPMSRSDSPLLIGGSKSIEVRGNRWGIRYGSLEGWIDEVRVSNTFRYDERGIKPQRHFKVDKHTIALWRFDEGAGAVRYTDASGNGYTLFAGGTLAVDAQSKFITTWGEIKENH